MIPELVNIGSPWKVLPPGIYVAMLEEIKVRFANTNYRKNLYSGFDRGINSLRESGCKTVYIDGSFTTDKPVPGDYDACWDTSGVDTTLLDPVLLDFNDNRLEQKRKYFGEFFPANFLANSFFTFLDFFQIDKYTGRQKGILRINL